MKARLTSKQSLKAERSERCRRLLTFHIYTKACADLQSQYDSLFIWCSASFESHHQYCGHSTFLSQAVQPSRKSAVKCLCKRQETRHVPSPQPHHYKAASVSRKRLAVCCTTNKASATNNNYLASLHAFVVLRKRRRPKTDWSTLRQDVRSQRTTQNFRL